MKIKRIFAVDIRQAIKQVRDQLGADAVILSNKPVDGGIELVAAIDYDEELLNQEQQAFEPKMNPLLKMVDDASSIEVPRSDDVALPRSKNRSRSSPNSSNNDQKCARIDSHIEWSQDPMLVNMRDELRVLRTLVESQMSEWTWRQTRRRQPARAELLRRLTRLGFSGPLSRELVDEVADESDLEQSWHLLRTAVTARIPINETEIIDRGGVVALVGPTGVGKTTSIAKIAARFCQRYGARNLALVSTDGYRIGAQEQLVNYGRILDVPVRVATNEDEYRIALNNFADRRLVLVDTAGMSRRDHRLLDQLKLLQSANTPVSTYMVLSATTQASTLAETVRAYEYASPHGCIITKVDEATGLGQVISSAMTHQLPVSYIGDGQRVPEDIHRARALELSERCWSMLDDPTIDVDEEILISNFGGLTANAN
ncbi:MAG TPA: flagellar biosynthesis protein FlhF [Chromatiaceae bacterium]|jgi:flagellar biosynthesis protein FlhF|nr:flagellar biosynthesis protein FlhF [Chromatiaceae bacterium]HIB85100.1 flagellar biosynthesis protein FlhF [Chromatiaceae bacterium]HIN82559.1 flagellar biosynthesis protein FlhF [Chromatiales bacterium]HIO53537.1 flagellar biosynthesis protein FlhF [Chromatiales bacterium]